MTAYIITAIATGNNNTSKSFIYAVNASVTGSIPNAHTDADNNPNAYTDTDGNAKPNVNTKTDAYPEANANTKISPYSAASPGASASVSIKGRRGTFRAVLSTPTNTNPEPSQELSGLKPSPRYLPVAGGGFSV